MGRTGRQVADDALELKQKRADMDAAERDRALLERAEKTAELRARRKAKEASDKQDAAGAHTPPGSRE